ncbi:MAG: CarD family transcriptional regulator [Spirochaetaceae bacterium]|jgi:CarD family transcriptional regulator|nr:CarD family transcriptional regulator [Spirochaetaceae bacterium]
MNDSKYTYKLRQKIVYPSQGVGLIKEIEEKEFKGEKIPYYTIFLERTDMTVMVPVDKAEELGLRAIVPQEDAERALEFIGEAFEPNTSDWKLRYQQNLDLLKKGGILDIGSIVRSLYYRSKVKDLPIMERKLYDQAVNLFEDEIGCSLKKPRSEVQKLILERFEKK